MDIKTTEDKFESYETTMVLVQNSGRPDYEYAEHEMPAPPREAGSGWVLQEKVRVRGLIVFRWRRACQDRAQSGY